MRHRVAIITERLRQRRTFPSVHAVLAGPAIIQSLSAADDCIVERVGKNP
jgi:hypothetical protein